MSVKVRVELPSSLCLLAGGIGHVVVVTVDGVVTQRTVLDRVEALYPMLRGTIRDQGTGVRRPFIRYFACGLDLSHEGPDVALPEAVARGDEALLVIGAIAGG